jgi:hypothetical protein
MIRRLALAAILLAGPAAAQQTNSAGPVSQMQNASTPLSGSELLYIVQGGQSRKITVDGLVGSTAGVSCSGTPTSSFASVNGIVTHC